MGQVNGLALAVLVCLAAAMPFVPSLLAGDVERDATATPSPHTDAHTGPPAPTEDGAASEAGTASSGDRTARTAATRTPTPPDGGTPAAEKTPRPEAGPASDPDGSPGPDGAATAAEPPASAAETTAESATPAESTVPPEPAPTDSSTPQTDAGPGESTAGTGPTTPEAPPAGPATPVAPPTEGGQPDGERAPVSGRPVIDVFAPNRTLAPGQQRPLDVQVVTDGFLEDDAGAADSPGADAVTTARNVRVSLAAGDAPLEVRSGTVALGDVRRGTVRRAPFAVAVAPDADPGVYDLSVAVEYAFVSPDADGDAQRTNVTQIRSVAVVVTDDPRFSVADVSADVQAGDDGTAEVEIENIGSETVSDAVVTVRSLSRSLVLDRGNRTGRFVGSWSAGQSRSVAFPVRAGNATGPGDYALVAFVRYTDQDGARRLSQPVPFGIDPDGEQTFTLDDVDSDLRVDSEGTVSGTITNEGPDDVTDAVVRVTDRSGELVVERRRSVLGDLDEGDSADVSVPVSVPRDAEPGDRPLTVVVEYLTADGDSRRSRRLVGVVSVDERRPDFALVDLNGTVPETAPETVTVRLRNRRDEAISDARIGLRSPNDALSVDGGANASRFVGNWSADETETVSFRVNATADAANQTYPLAITVAYTDADGEARRSAPLRTRLTPVAEQRFGLRVLNSGLRVGEEGRVRVSVTNRGPWNVTDAVVRLRDAPDRLAGARSTGVLGGLAHDASANASVAIDVAGNADPGLRQLTFVVQYRTPDGDVRQSSRLFARVVVGAEFDRFLLADVDSTVQVGADGTLSVTLRNRGNRTIRDARVRLRANSRSLRVDGGDNGTRFVGRWRPGQRRTVTYDVGATNRSGVQAYAFRARVAYTGADGDAAVSTPVRFGVTPLAEQTFALGSVASRLRVGEEGTVRATLSNTGPRGVSEAVLALVTDAPTIDPQEVEYAVDGLAPGERTRVAFPIDVTETAEPGPRQLTFRVEYLDGNGDRRRSDLVTALVRVREQRDAFVITVESATVDVGATETVVLSVRNNRDVPVRNANAEIFLTDPLDSGDDTAFVSRIAPNESVRLGFEVSAADGTSPKTYPLKINVQYQEPDGDTKLSETYQVGVRVTEPADEGLLGWLVPGSAIALGVVLGTRVGRTRLRDDDE
jgi:hypothetical protein